MKIAQEINRHRAAYFPIMLVAMLMAVIMLQGCDHPPQSSELGSIAGLAELDRPDSATGHSGILMFLAGTSFQARTDTQGRYRIDGIPAGTYDLVAEKEGFQGQVFNGVLVNPAVNTAQAPLQPPRASLARIVASSAGTTSGTPELGTIRGSVLLDGMEPNKNGGVRVEVNGTGFVTVSANNGQYRILNVEPGSYSLSFYKDGYRDYTTEDIAVTTGITEVKTQALELVQEGDTVSPVAAVTAAYIQSNRTTASASEPPGPDEPRSIVGVVEVKDPQGEPVTDFSNVTVGINGTSTVAEISDQGQFRFDNLTSGTYTLIGTLGEGPVMQQVVDLTGQRSASVVMKLGGPVVAAEGAGTVRGKVILVDAEDKPMPDASGVQVAAQGTQVLATTAADGTFTLSGLSPAAYTISAAKEGFETATVPDVAVTAEGPAEAGEIRLLIKQDRPRVLATEPARNARDVPVGIDLPIIVKFSDRMNAATVKDSISLTPSTPFTADIGKGAGEGADDNTLVIRLRNDDPKAPIQFGANYRITIASTAANLTGVAMAEAYTFDFRTANPGVTNTFPANNASNVYVDQLNNPVLISFNTRLDPETINERNIRVKPDNGISVSTTYTDNDNTGWTTVRVATQWQPNTAYTVTVSRRVKAKNGQSLGNTPYTLRFRTQPLEIMSMPIITTR